MECGLETLVEAWENRMGLRSCTWGEASEWPFAESIAKDDFLILGATPISARPKLPDGPLLRITTRFFKVLLARFLVNVYKSFHDETASAN